MGKTQHQEEKKETIMLNRLFIISTLSVLLLLQTTLIGFAEENKATGFIYVKQIDDVWWFIGPDGNKFVSMGVNHIEPHLWLAPYNKKATLKKYGNDMITSKDHFNPNGTASQKWIERQVEIAKDVNFNTFGKHTHPSIKPEHYNKDIYFVASLETAPLAGWKERRGQGPRPDVFSLDFKTFLENRIRKVCQANKNNPNLIGYLYTDVPSWIMGRGDQKARNNTTMIYPWINAILPLGETSPGKWRWLEHLKTRYLDAEAAAKVWGMPVSPTYGISWNDLSQLVNWNNPTDAKKAKSDMLAFMPIIVEQWYSLHKELIHKYDKNHLILGDKNLLNWHYEWMYPSLKRHVDVICVQAYGRWKDDIKITNTIYEKTGKPIFNGDGCFGHAGPQQQKWGVKGFRTGAKSKDEVAALYAETLKGMMATPYMIGWHHCGYIEQWDESERGDAPRNENGFIDPFENYNTILTHTMREMNSKAVELHSKAK